MENQINQSSAPISTTRCAIIVIVMAFIAGNSGYAQDAGKLNLAFRPSANYPLQDLGDFGLKAGGGFEATLSYQFVPKFAVYGGWGWNTFSLSQSDPSVAHFEETGYRLGIQYNSPFSRDSKFNLLLSGGAIFNHIETENDDGDIIGDSGHGPGWEVEGGVAIPLSEKWKIAPSLRYHSLPSEVVTGAQSQSVRLDYLSVGVAVIWTLN